MLSRADFIDFVQTQADFLNMRYFDGCLKFHIELAEHESVRWYAKCFRSSPEERKTSKLLFNPVMLHATLHEIEAIISHEIIHVAQIALGLKMGHGRPFRELAKKFGIPDEYSQACASVSVRLLRDMKRDREPRI